VLVTIDYTTLNDFGYAIVLDSDYCFSNATVEGTPSIQTYDVANSTAHKIAARPAA